MTQKRLLTAVSALVACQLLVTAAVAAPRRHGGGFQEGYEFNPYLTLTDFDSKSEIEDDFGAGFRFGYLFNPHHEIEFLFNGVSTEDRVFLGETVDVQNLQVAYVFNFTSRDVVPYLTAGLGFVHTDDSALGSETDQVLGLGAGIRFFLGRVLYARFELRGNYFEGGGNVYANGEGFSFKEFAFGVGWRLPVR